MLTIHEIKDKLKEFDEVSLLEILDISSEELVEYFADKIEDKLEKLKRELDDA